MMLRGITIEVRGLQSSSMGKGNDGAPGEYTYRSRDATLRYTRTQRPDPEFGVIVEASATMRAPCLVQPFVPNGAEFKAIRHTSGSSEEGPSLYLANSTAEALGISLGHLAP